MRLRWTFVVLPSPGGRAATNPSRSDVVVDCPPGTTLGQVVELVPDLAQGAAPLLLDGPPGVQVSVDGIRLAADARVGRAPLLDGAVLTVQPSPAETRRTTHPRLGTVSPAAGAEPLHLLELVVLAGPDAGRSHPLLGGRLTCGRSPGCDVTIGDPRLSRTHCELVLGVDGVTVVDLGSTNGTLLPADPQDTVAADVSGPAAAGSAPRPLGLGEHCRIGASIVTLRQSQTSHLRQQAPPETGLGTRLVHRSPRVRPPERAPVLRLPAPARPARAAAFPVLAVVLPALAATGLAVWTGSMTYLVLAGLGPLLVAGGWFGSRREARRDGLLGRREHARVSSQLREQAQRAAHVLAGARAEALPGPDTLLQQCLHPSGRLWERDPDDDDALRVRLGRAVPGTVCPPDERGDGDLAGSDRAALLPQVCLAAPDGERTPLPTAADLVSVDLRAGALGIVEPGDDPSSARLVVGQLVALLPPTSTNVVAVLGAGARGRWDWLRLLPHTGGAAVGDARGALPDVSSSSAAAAARAVGELVAVRSAAPAGSVGHRARRQALLVVLDDPDGEVDPTDLSWLPAAHLVDVHVLAVSPDAARVPRGCGYVVVPASDDGVEVVVTRTADGSTAGATTDRVGPWWSERVSRGLAPLRPSSAEGSDPLPDEVHLDDLLGTGVEQVLHRWSQPVPGLPVPLGVGRAGIVTVDLTRAGPHALVAGTTGSGKSELLRTWLLALAASRPPSEVAFLLVDYKGGASFDDLAALPHTVGLLTDLDGGATSRVLHSLRAEIHRRERLLASAGARDLEAYRTTAAATEALPRLLVVVDEFRILAEDAPEVLGEFVRLAATGRSLGMHLVLATQRPGGVVSADIRANAALRIALRVQDASESRDVVDRPDAAWLPAGRPGRAVLVGSDLDETVQTAFSGSVGRSAVRLSVLTGSSGPSDHQAPFCRTDEPAPDPGTGLPSAVTGVLRAAEQAGVPRAASPWLPPLPAVLDRPVGWADTCPAGTLLLGTTDLPWSQARGPLGWSPTEDGPAIVLGGPRSGRSSTLRAVAHAASNQGVPVVHLSGEAGGAGDPDHLVDVLEALAAAPSPWHEHPGTDAGRGPDGPGPSQGSSHPRLRVLLLVDDTDTLLDPSSDPTAVDLLGRLLRTGHRAGVGVVLAGGRSLAGSRLAAAARVRLVHRTTDGTDAVVAGVPAAARELPALPGRCAVLGLRGQDPPPGAWLQAQVFAPGTATASPELPEASRPPGPATVAPGWLPRVLPPSVGAQTLPPPRPGALPLGVVSPDGSPWALETGGRGLFAVAGPPRSGRTTALQLLAAQGVRAGLGVAWLPAAGAPTHGRSTITGTDGGAADGPSVDLLLVDDAERLDPAALAWLEAWLSDGSGALAGRLTTRATVVLAGATEWFTDGFRGLPALVRRSGQGLVLSPGRTEVRDVLGGRTSVQQRTRAPGRGLLVDRGRIVRIQVARPDIRVGPDEPPGHRITHHAPARTTVWGEHDRRHT